uniref:Uncharacterized protein n=1 Tax=Streptomyces sp. NBC_01393 TaxID=2903851 RepID=A0AAU3I7Y4_9ACTN
MNLLSLRTLLFRLLNGSLPPQLDDVLSVAYVNPQDTGPWSLLTVVDDGVGGRRTFRIDVTEVP